MDAQSNSIANPADIIDSKNKKYKQIISMLNKLGIFALALVGLRLAYDSYIQASHPA
jgi:hypothetical protein